MKPISVVLESASKRTLALVPAWPGWCRSGRDGDAALQSLLDSAHRYAKVMQVAGIKFQLPASLSDLNVTERVQGNATTDFGAPAIILDTDRDAVTASEAKLWRGILQASWQVFDDAAQRADGRELRKGPRGGGRELDAIVHHVLEADLEYLKRLAWKQKPQAGKTTAETLHAVREDMLRALEAAIRDGVPAQGPRGGAMWPPRYFVRRVAWHVLDHVWEIEDRIV